MDSRSWRDDADLAEVYALWGGHAYGRGLDGRAAREDMESAYRRISVAVKNTDTREHDIADSDDYYQYHGGMVAAVRALTGSAPRAYVGDSTRPDYVRTRSPGGGVGPGVPLPGGEPALDRRDEAARVQGRVRARRDRGLPVRLGRHHRGGRPTGCTSSSRPATCSTRRPAQFLEKSNPWALRAITERLLEAADRGLWAAPEADTLASLRDAYLEVEGQLEEGEP